MKASLQDKGREKKQKSCHINKRMYGMYIHERMNMMEAYYAHTKSCPLFKLEMP